ncbi:DUF3106 domain-containing protein [Glaciimonas immobilis]|uniref:DUF3106 domain-containing protein n=1 Tax=Glaciimonas immobilis TaxID=728004 RepID=A0A840S0U0_9BURK|nr:DUF3106 domain-containing protein [Glaciimonas immobilis]KAF3996654.1 DUF3106 domain-containing protein [Glaciimonas immobilis]MBB5202494.1 hypothetical protein [Glaciimonas immobilis]
MTLITTLKNIDQHPASGHTSAPRGAFFKRIFKSRAALAALVTVAAMVIGSVSVLVRTSHAAGTPGTGITAASAPNATNGANAASAASADATAKTGELAIKRTPAALPKVIKESDSKTEWENLTVAQKQTLAPLEAGWNNQKLSTRKKWIEISKRFGSLSPAEQSRVQDRMHDWVTLTPAQRREVRENYARTRRLDTEQRAKRWAEYQHLPEAEKQKLAAEAAAANNRKRVTSQVLSIPTKPILVKPIQLTPKPAAPVPSATAPVPALPAAPAPPSAPTPPLDSGY